MIRLLMLTRGIGAFVLLGGLSVFLGASPVSAGGVVGNGTPASCTQTAFDSKFNTGGTITFNCGTSPKTIVLTSLHTVSVNTVIDGGKKITLAAQGNSLFKVLAGKSLTLKNITLRDGNAAGAGALENFGTTLLQKVTLTNNQSSSGAGAIVNHGTLTLKNSNVNGNQGAYGAVMHESGTLTVDSTTFMSNSGQDGGALYINSGATSTISNSTFSENTASYGGALENNGTLSVTRTTFDKNFATADGGAIWNLSGNLTLQDTYLSRNTSGTTGGALSNYGNQMTLRRTTIALNTTTGQGGGIYNDGTATLENVTLGENEAANGGGYYQSFGTSTLNFVTMTSNNGTARGGAIYRSGGSISLRNTLLAYNSSENCYGTVSSQGHNMSYDATCAGFNQSGDQNNIEQYMSSLGYRGGYAPTYLPSEPLYNVNDGINTGVPTTDQRGMPRFIGTAPDIGAVEFCETVPEKPKLLSPAKGTTVNKRRVVLDWNDPVCGTLFYVELRRDSKNGTLVVNPPQPLGVSTFKTPVLMRGHKYVWRVFTVGDSTMNPAVSGWFTFSVP